MSPSCAPSCAISAPATATWTKARCAPTSTSRCASLAAQLGTRCEIKNVNSIRFIGQAIEFEARRQIEHPGGRRQDRSGNPAVRSATRARRAPCAPRKTRTTTATSPIRTCCRWSSTTSSSAKLLADLPELPDDKKIALRQGSRPFGLRRLGARLGEGDRRLLRGRWPTGRDGKLAANWVINDLLGQLNKAGKDIDKCSGVARSARCGHRPDQATAPSPARSPRTCSRSSGTKVAIRASWSKAVA